MAIFVGNTAISKVYLGNTEVSQIYMRGNPILSTGLFDFTSFTFTSGGQLGLYGPTLQTLLNSADYDTATNPWLSDTAYFDMTTTGIQEWTVPSTKTYTIDAYGATGGYTYLLSTSTISYGGRGARIKGDFSLTEGDIIKILVGQRGRNNPRDSRGSGGGGGTFIYNSTTSTLLIAAGGGGGGGQYTRVGNSDANPTSTSGNAGLRSSAGVGGTNGNGGGGVYSGGGAGWIGNGTDTSYGKGGKTFNNGGQGGSNRSTLVDDDNSNSNGKPGGFGGGGGSWIGSGGGGGYSGGGAGGWSYSGEGGGGGSYIEASATNTTTELNTSVNNGNGEVIITKL